ncbi:phage tail tip fiber protein [Azospirillum brasilense]|uniref:phage tail tip fiber protein n=1 Tax=Azospirillum brasilense TaxID=192 RepID=UPI001FFE6BB4|nr:DUF1983 domain-containing protein [Azospirillum brasilense]
MAFVYPDRASEVTTSTGDQGDIILQGPEPSFWSFTSRMAVGDETTVCREDGLTSELVRVRLVAPDRLRYLAVYGSSNGGARVVWPAGQQRVYATQLGRYALLPPDAGQAGRPVVVQPDGTYGAGALTVPVPTGLTVGTLLDAASAGGRPDGAVLIRLVVTWDELPDLDYELEIRDGLTTGWPGTASNPALIPAGGGRCVVNVVGGYTYGVRLRARAVGGVSGWTPEKTIAATGDDVPPGPPTDMAVTEVYGGAVFTFTPPADADTLEVRFYAAPAADKTAAMLVGAGLRRVTLTGLTAGDTRWVWAASVDTSGNEGEWIALGPVTALRIEPGDLAAELGERIERLSDVDPASLGLAEEAALEAVLAAHEVRLGAQRRLAQAMTGVDATIDGVRDRLAGVETGLQQEVTTLTDETAALTRSLTTLGAVVEDNTAAIQAEQTARADADEALAESVTLVAAQAGNALAAVQTEATTRANADSALGQRIDAVVADTADNAAAILAEQTARTNADGALANTLTSVSAQATRTRTFRQATAPAAPQAGDLWYDTASNNAPKRWSGTGWESTEDPRIAATAAAVVAEQTARADGDSALASSISIVSAQASRSRTFRQSAAPAAPQAGDVWYDTANGNAAKRYNGTAWELVDDARLAANAAAVTSEATARADADASLASQITTVSAQATRTRTFRQATAPGGPQTGDIWYDTSSNNAPKRYTGTVWENVEDPRTASNTAAIQAEQTARADGDAALTTQVNTAISKADRVRTFRQASAPASPQTGDVWYDTANNSVPKRWSGTAWESAEDPRIGQNVAAIQTEATTRANEDEALSQHITKLFARFSGGTNLVQRLNRWTSAFPVTEDATFASRYRVRVSGNAQSTVSPVLTELKPDTDYVLSFKARLAAGASSELHADLNPDTLPETAFAVTSSEWTTFSTVWKSSLAAIKNCRLRFFQYNLAGAQVDVTDVQLEEGNTPSAWSLAPGEMVAMVQQEADARASALGSMSTRIDTVQTLADGNYAAIQEQALSIDGLSAQYTVKVDVNGYVSGFGLATTAKDGVPTSTFTVLAEKFEITAPGGSKISPFVVQNGTVYLRSVVIGTGWIGDTHIGPNGIDAKHLKASSVLTDSIRIGSASGSTLSTVVSQAATGAQDPAGRINAGSTSINPGKIIVKGSNTLTTVGGWFYGNTTEIDGGKIAAETVTAREVKALSLTGAHVAAGSLTVDKFAQFSTGNKLSNSGFEAGWACWNLTVYNTGGANLIAGVEFQENGPGSDWTLVGGHMLWVRQIGATAPSNNWTSYYSHPDNNWLGIPIDPSKTCEFSIYTGAHRCMTQVGVAFYNAAGLNIGETFGTTNNEEGGGGRSLAGYKRLWVKATPPAGAVAARPILIKWNTKPGNADSWGFFVMPFFGECAPNATEPQPWQPGGVTKIFGGNLVAETVTSTHLATGSVTANKINARTIVGDHLEVGTIYGSLIGQAAVTTLKIEGNSVTVPAGYYQPDDRWIGNTFTTPNNQDYDYGTTSAIVTDGSPVLVMAAATCRVDGGITNNNNIAGWVLRIQNYNSASHAEVTKASIVVQSIAVGNSWPGNAGAYAAVALDRPPANITVQYRLVFAKGFSDGPACYVGNRGIAAMLARR